MLYHFGRCTRRGKQDGIWRFCRQHTGVRLFDKSRRQTTWLPRGSLMKARGQRCTCLCLVLKHRHGSDKSVNLGLSRRLLTCACPLPLSSPVAVKSFAGKEHIHEALPLGAKRLVKPLDRSKGIQILLAGTQGGYSLVQGKVLAHSHERKHTSWVAVLCPGRCSSTALKSLSAASRLRVQVVHECECVCCVHASGECLLAGKYVHWWQRQCSDHKQALGCNAEVATNLPSILCLLNSIEVGLEAASTFKRNFPNSWKRYEIGKGAHEHTRTLRMYTLPHQPAHLLQELATGDVALQMPQLACVLRARDRWTCSLLKVQDTTYLDIPAVQLNASIQVPQRLSLQIRASTS